MHVAYIHQHFTTTAGATGTRSYELAQRLIRAGHRVTMICGTFDLSDVKATPGRRVADLQIDGIHVKCIAEPYANRMGFLRRVLAFGRFARTATRVVRSLDADLIFATSTPLTVGIPGMKGARHLRVPFVFEVRDLWPELPIAMGIIRNPALIWYTRRMERRIYMAADHIIALSPGMKEGICRTGYPPERVTMIPNGCDLELFRPCDQRLDDPRFGSADEFRAIFTGAHGQANGLDAVLDAAAELKRRGEKGIRIVFLGKGGRKQELIARAQRDGLGSLVTFLDPIPKKELAHVLPRLDAGLMVLRNVPAFYYGTSPNKFFDYIACGIPVINNYPGWLADLIREHRCGLAVPPDDPRAFADALLWLRDNRAQAREMGRRGRLLAERHFDRDRLAACFVRTLERVADEHRAARS